MAPATYLEEVIKDTCGYPYAQLPDTLRTRIVEIAKQTSSPQDVHDELLLPPDTARQMNIVDLITVVAATVQIVEFVWKLWEKHQSKERINKDEVALHPAARDLGQNFAKTFSAALNRLPPRQG